MRHVTDSPVAQQACAFRLPLIAQLTGLVLISLPVQGFTNSTQLDQVIERQTIHVASVAGSSTFFGQDGFMHGFGYDLTRAYAQDIHVKLEFKAYPSTQAALNAVKAGRADVALTTANSAQTQQLALHSVDLTCGQPQALAKNGLDTNLNWSFANQQDPLVESLHGFACQERQLGATKRLAAFYNQNMMQDQIERMSFNKAINQRLPKYVSSFQINAKQHQLDWHLLAAMGYQESHLNANAISPTGVTGLMMLTSNTAKGLGITNRRDPIQSIQGGAKYFGQLVKQYQHIPKGDRVWFALAAYNMGPNALDNVCKQVKQSGQNPTRWANVYRYMADNATQKSKYRQAMHYVTRIRAYMETLKQEQVLTRL